MNNSIKDKGNEAIAIAVVIYGSKLTECNVYKTLIKNNADKIDCLLVLTIPRQLNMKNRNMERYLRIFLEPKESGRI